MSHLEFRSVHHFFFFLEINDVIVCVQCSVCVCVYVAMKGLEGGANETQATFDSCTVDKVTHCELTSRYA